jgi:hypothetical protein
LLHHCPHAGGHLSWIFSGTCKDVWLSW